MRIYKIASNEKSINDLVDYDEGEILWELVNLWESDEPLPVHSISNDGLKKLNTYPSHENILSAYENSSRVENKNIVNSWKKQDLSNEIIILFEDSVVDGHHRAIAAIEKGVGLQYIDIAELPES